jgi:peptide-methionine (S)-S-oxide reductase
MRANIVSLTAAIAISAAVIVAWSAGAFTPTSPPDAPPTAAPPPRLVVAGQERAVPMLGATSVGLAGAPVGLVPILATSALVSPGIEERATFGNGCFWCTEAIFQQVKGVRSVVSGYSGGSVANPTYREVCSGSTGHAEAIQITYDPSVVTFAELLEVFWKTHDPTTPNQQGNDIGTQYRSVVFYHNARQRDLAETYKRKLDEADAFTGPIVTEIVPYTAFYPAEAYHQNFYQEHRYHPYCRAVIRPKLEKFNKVFLSK